ncbi:hypothetical protein NSB27_15980 [Murimonas intestini]|nr:hypothetical protein [Murimonas intestini]
MSERQSGFELFINIYRFEPKSLGLLSDKNITDEVIYYINAQKKENNEGRSGRNSVL